VTAAALGQVPPRAPAPAAGRGPAGVILRRRPEPATVSLGASPGGLSPSVIPAAAFRVRRLTGGAGRGPSTENIRPCNTVTTHGLVTP
jgi:hypothetical protein